MNTPFPDTVFALHVIDVLQRYGEEIPETVLRYMASVSEDDIFDDVAWASARWAACCAIENNLRDEPLRATKLFADLAMGVTEKTVYICRDLFHNLFIETTFIDLCHVSGKCEDSRYALAAVLMLHRQGLVSVDELNRGLSDILGRPATVRDTVNDCAGQIGEALFGPVWSALYSNGPLSEKDVIDLVLRDRPPFYAEPTKQRPYSTKIADISLE